MNASVECDVIELDLSRMKFQDIEVSVIIPVFNAGEYLDFLMKSLQLQDFEGWEVIAVNDGSTDKSLSNLRNWEKRDSRIRVIDQANKGVSEARNEGLKHAKGKWICFADSDDYLPKGSLKRRLEYAEQSNLDLLICNGFHFKKSTNFPKNPMLINQQWEKVVTGNEWVVHATKHREWPHYVWMQLIRRSFLEENNLSFAKDIWHEDILWTCELALKAKRVSFMDEICYGYRLNPNSIMNTESDEFLEARASGYIFVISKLGGLAKTPDENLNKALLFQANREGGHLARLLKKGIESEDVKGRLARKSLTLNIHKITFKGVSNVRDLWRFFRLWWVVNLKARQ
ncbi:MAG: glycosyltransferase [bacterium]